jgi:hypothetical protein
MDFGKLMESSQMPDEKPSFNAMDFSTALDFVPPEFLAWLESLSGSGKEDLILVPDREWIYLGQIREVVAGQKQVALRWGRISRKNLKKEIANAPVGGLGLVTVIVCGDFEKAQTVELAAWLTKQARKKDFSFISMTGAATTKEAINNLMNWRPPLIGTA